jgi:molybdate-binding protein
MTSELLTPESSAIHKFVFSDDTVTVTFTYNLEKEYSFVVNTETTTMDSIRALIEAAESKGKALAQLRKFNELIAI